MSPLSFIILLLLLLDLNVRYGRKCWANAHTPPIPQKFDGFVYGGNASKFSPDVIVIEAFLDPVCPDSRNAWPSLKRAVQFYGPRISLIVHTFPLPYHDNAFVTSQALHIVNDLTSSAAYTLLEIFFENQENFYTRSTKGKTKTTITNDVIGLATKALGSKYYWAIKSGFDNRYPNMLTRIAFKYGCSRGVSGTPTFFVNGFRVPDSYNAKDYNGWRRIIDPLINSEAEGGSQYHYMMNDTLTELFQNDGLC